MTCPCSTVDHRNLSEPCGCFCHRLADLLDSHGIADHTLFDDLLALWQQRPRTDAHYTSATLADELAKTRDLVRELLRCFPPTSQLPCVARARELLGDK